MDGSGTPAGWYPIDPRSPRELRYWDGHRWTDHAHLTDAAQVEVRPGAAPSGGVPAWLVSWPMIALGFLLCLLPGMALLWLRPSTSVKGKGIITAAVAALVAVGMVAGADAPAGEPSVDASDLVAQSAPLAPAPSESVTDTPLEAPTPSESSTPSPSASASAAATASTADKGTALAEVSNLQVKGRAAKTGYARDQFGSGWVDVDRNGCDTRNDVLRAQLRDKEMSGWCKVLAGTLDDEYTGSTIRFDHGGASEVDIDHVVALGDAWQKGAAKWTFAKRVAFANDPLNLQPVDAGANRQKGEGDTATWLPPNKGYRCTYVARQVAVKAKYKVWVTAAEKDAMTRVLGACPDTMLPQPGSQPTIASNTGGRPPASSTPKPTRTPSKPSPTPKPTRTPSKPRPTPKPTRTPSKPRPTPKSTTDPQFGTCGAANDAGFGPYVQGKDPEYDWYQDRDHDGVVCE